MALNLKTAQNLTTIPSRARGDVDDSARQEMYAEFFALIDAAKETGVFGPATVEGESECNRYSNALASFKTAHPASWACLTTRGNEYEPGTGKTLVMRIYAASRPSESKLAKVRRTA